MIFNEHDFEDAPIDLDLEIKKNVWHGIAKVQGEDVDVVVYVPSYLVKERGKSMTAFEVKRVDYHSDLALYELFSRYEMRSR